MLTIRRSEDRGRANYGWLDTRHTFSFGAYYDPAHMGFRSLRVINDDRVAPGAGFPRHPHRDMEILTYVLDGALEHKDSLGNGSIIRRGEVQRMSAGTGILHSEFNHSSGASVRFLQIWLLPNRRGLAPSYQQKTIANADHGGLLRLVASPDEADDSILLQQDARLYVAHLASGDRVEHALRPDRHAWIHVARGSVKAGEHELREGDGAALSGPAIVALTGVDSAEVLIFDLS
ncbi:MAG: pirin family protein [Deltaproteobacteria bacterium]|nr:pirin family protein [Deltaproteobacteria bacterium]